MTTQELIALIANLCSRIFSILLIIGYSVCDDDEAIACLDEQNEWFDRTIQEIEVQMMIADLYRREQ